MFVLRRVSTDAMKARKPRISALSPKLSNVTSGAGSLRTRSFSFAACMINDIVTLNVATSFDPLEVIVAFFRYSLLSAVYTALLAVIVMQLIDLLPRKMVRSGGRY